MNTQEFSHQFDTLLNSHAVAAGFGKADSPATIELDEYEKSLFLTNSQEEIALSLYTGRNSSGLSFEETEELRRYLSNLVCEAKLEPIKNTSGNPIGITDKNSYFFSLPDGSVEEPKEGEEKKDPLPAVWFITYESVALEKGKCENHSSMEVVPVRQDEYHKIKKNPFRGANDRRALRLDLSEGNVEIVCKYPVSEYYIRYLKQLKPIILTQLDDDTELRGEKTPMTSELPESLHLRILNRAVEMALQSRGYTRNNNNRE